MSERVDTIKFDLWNEECKKLLSGKTFVRDKRLLYPSTIEEFKIKYYDRGYTPQQVLDEMRYDSTRAEWQL